MTPSLAKVTAERDDLQTRLKALEHVAFEVMRERDRALAELARLQQLSLTGEADVQSRKLGLR